MVEVNIKNINSFHGSWIIIYSDDRNFFEFVHVLDCQDKDFLSIGIQKQLLKLIQTENNNPKIHANRFVDYYELRETKTFLKNRKKNTNNRQWFILSGSKQEVNKIYFGK